jgi:hypothetical protein
MPSQLSTVDLIVCGGTHWSNVPPTRPSFLPGFTAGADLKTVRRCGIPGADTE